MGRRRVTGPGALLRTGNTSHLHEWGSGAVAKVLRPDIPGHWAEREAVTTELVRSVGLPAPTVLDLVSVDGCPAIVFERVPGPSMLEEAVRRPEQTRGLADELCRLQRLLAEVPAPASLPRLRDRLRSNITSADVDEPLRAQALRDLDDLPEGTAVCHFDLHPNNVLLGPDGPVVIDWFDAAAGDPAADVVRTSLLLRPELGDGHLDGAPAELVRAFLDLHRSDSADVLAADPGWERVVCTARIAEPVGEAAHVELRRRACRRGRRDVVVRP